MITKNNCPECGSNNYKKNGHTHNGKQNHQCKDCGREFVLNPEKEIISELLSLFSTIFIGKWGISFLGGLFSLLILALVYFYVYWLKRHGFLH